MSAYDLPSRPHTICSAGPRGLRFFPAFGRSMLKPASHRRRRATLWLRLSCAALAPCPGSRPHSWTLKATNLAYHRYYSCQAKSPITPGKRGIQCAGCACFMGAVRSVFSRPGFLLVSMRAARAPRLQKTTRRGASSVVNWSYEMAARYSVAGGRYFPADCLRAISHRTPLIRRRFGENREKFCAPWPHGFAG